MSTVSTERVNLRHLSESQRTYGNPQKPWVRRAQAVGLLVTGLLFLGGAGTELAYNGVVADAIGSAPLGLSLGFGCVIGTSLAIVGLKELRGEPDYTLIKNRRKAIQHLQEGDWKEIYDTFDMGYDGGEWGIDPLVRQDVISECEGDAIKAVFNRMGTKRPSENTEEWKRAEKEWAALQLTLQPKLYVGESQMSSLGPDEDEQFNISNKVY